MLQTAQAKCLIFSHARLALLLPAGLSRDQPGSPSAGWAWAIPAPSQLPEIPMMLWPLWFLLFMSHFESSGLPSVLLTSPVPYQTVPFYDPQCHWRVLAPELSGQFCSPCSSMDRADQYPNPAGETILLPTLSGLLLSLFSFFNYALKPLFLLILGFWWVFFPRERKQVEIIITWPETRKWQIQKEA